MQNVRGHSASGVEKTKVFYNTYITVAKGNTSLQTQFAASLSAKAENITLPKTIASLKYLPRYLL